VLSTTRARADEGEIEGLKYNRLSAVFVNAIRDQQAQIERQQKQITEQQGELTALKVLVCQSHPDTDICRQLGEDCNAESERVLSAACLAIERRL
jgi:hypothetical protein